MEDTTRKLEMDNQQGCGQQSGTPNMAVSQNPQIVPSAGGPVKPARYCPDNLAALMECPFCGA